MVPSSESDAGSATVAGVAAGVDGPGAMVAFADAGADELLVLVAEGASKLLSFVGVAAG